MPFRIIDGPLYQWDTGRYAEIIDRPCDYVDIGHKGSGVAAVRKIVDGKVRIPDVLLQQAGTLAFYTIVSTADGQHTRTEHLSTVTARPRPDEYVYTDDEVLTWQQLDERVTRLEQTGGNVNAPVLSVNGQTGEVELTAADVGEEPKSGAYELIDEITFEEAAALIVTEEPDGTPYKFAKLLLLCSAPAGNENPGDVSVMFPGTIDSIPAASWSGSASVALAHYGEIQAVNGYWRAEWSTGQNYFVWAKNMTGYNRIVNCNQRNSAYAYISGLKSTGMFRAGSVLSIYGIRYKEDV